mmetsp:Transcript_61373/g.138144  ORF Transcript_61373/g.138144 Transcript_61373/m.138144 type:complete len:200 (+) Transcript_61373:143-742(+)
MPLGRLVLRRGLGALGALLLRVGAPATSSAWAQRDAAARPRCFFLLRLQCQARLVNILHELVPDAEEFVTRLSVAAVFHVEVDAQLRVLLQNALVAHLQLLQFRQAHRYDLAVLHEHNILCPFACGPDHLQDALGLAAEQPELLRDLLELRAGGAPDPLGVLPRREQLLHFARILCLHLLDQVIDKCDAGSGCGGVSLR